MKRYVLSMLAVLALSPAAWGYYISEMSVSPANPTNFNSVTVTVKGNAPATNYHLDDTNLRRLGNVFYLDMYWASVGYGGMALTPYTHQESLGLLNAGKYTVIVRSIYNGLAREMKTISFTVSSVWGALPTTTWPGLFWYSLLWPGMNGSGSYVQMQSIIIGDGSVSFDISFNTGGTAQ